MGANDRHKSLLQFVRRVVDVPADYSFDDLLEFRKVIEQEYPSLRRVLEGYLELAHRSQTEVPHRARGPRRSSSQMHLFDLLRERRLFPQNSDLADFAGRVLPTMSRHRFDKMSRGDIAARIIEYLETQGPETREQLEASMREALTTGASRPSARRSFLSKWEKIIKGIEL